MAVHFQLDPDDSAAGSFRFSGVEQAILDEFDDLLESRGWGAEAPDADYIRALKGIIRRAPGFNDAYAHLGNALLDHEPRKALAAYREGIDMAEQAMPAGFDGETNYHDLDNRPYIRALIGMALAHSRLHEHREAANTLEKLLRRSPDNGHAEWLIGSEYLRSKRPGKARKALEKVCSHYPAAHYELGLYYLGNQHWAAAAAALRRGFCQNPYIAEMLQGNPEPEPLPIFHGSNLNDTDGAYDYVRGYGQLWYADPEYRAFLRYLFNQSDVMRERAEYRSCQEEAWWSPAGDRGRTDGIKRMHAILSAIDETSSEPLVSRRTNAYGYGTVPWNPAKRPY
jgi:tetratricopeptide (TPR) repeat protein